jgi:hypothetical protein
LILAWALTIHKAQGSTLDIAEVDAGSGIFECGQTYVALSRVKSLEGLYLCSFDANRIKINRKVQEFYEILGQHDANLKTSIEQISEAYIESSEIPLAEAVLIEPTTIEQNTTRIVYL